MARLPDIMPINHVHAPHAYCTLWSVLHCISLKMCKRCVKFDISLFTRRLPRAISACLRFNAKKWERKIFIFFCSLKSDVGYSNCLFHDAAYKTCLYLFDNFIDFKQLFIDIINYANCGAVDKWCTNKISRDKKKDKKKLTSKKRHEAFSPNLTRWIQAQRWIDIIIYYIIVLHLIFGYVFFFSLHLPR